MQNDSSAKQSMESYSIDDRSVSKKEFESFLKILLGKENYRCKKTASGGVVTYKTKDHSGRHYDVFMETGGENRNSIHASLK